MFSAADAMRVISARGATGRLKVMAQNGDTAQIWFDLGMVVAADHGDDPEAADVVAAVTEWTLGSFAFDDADPPAADAAPQPAEMLLSMVESETDLMVSADTEISMSAALPNAPAVIDVVTWQVLATIDPGSTVSSLAARLHAPVSEVEAIVTDLAGRGLLDVSAVANLHVVDDEAPKEEPPTEAANVDVSAELHGDLLAFDPALLEEVDDAAALESAAPERAAEKPPMPAQAQEALISMDDPAVAPAAEPEVANTEPTPLVTAGNLFRLDDEHDEPALANDAAPMPASSEPAPLDSVVPHAATEDIDTDLLIAALDSPEPEPEPVETARAAPTTDAEPSDVADIDHAASDEADSETGDSRSVLLRFLGTVDGDS